MRRWRALSFAILLSQALLSIPVAQNKAQAVSIEATTLIKQDPAFKSPVHDALPRVNPVPFHPMNSPSKWSNGTRLWILVPAFDNDGMPTIDEFGTKTATFVFLQLWKDLIKRPTPNPKGLDFGDAGITWDFDALPPQTFEEAIALDALETEEEEEGPILMTFWGRISSWAGTVVLDARLAIRSNEAAAAFTKNAWKIPPSALGSRREVVLPLPAMNYEFAPISLSPDAVSALSSPEGIPILSAASANAQVVGHAGEYFTRIGQEGNFAKVQVRGLKEPAWIYIPTLSNESTEAFDFTSAILKILRHDWDGATVHLRRAISIGHSNVSVTEDGKLLLALCLSQTDHYDDSISLLKVARTYPWHSQRADQYLAMAYLAAISRGGSQVMQYRDELDKIIALSGSSLQSPYSQWWQELSQARSWRTEQSQAAVQRSTVDDGVLREQLKRDLEQERRYRSLLLARRLIAIAAFPCLGVFFGGFWLLYNSGNASLVLTRRTVLLAALLTTLFSISTGIGGTAILHVQQSNGFLEGSLFGILTALSTFGLVFGYLSFRLESERRSLRRG